MRRQRSLQGRGISPTVNSGSRPTFREYDRLVSHAETRVRQSRPHLYESARKRHRILVDQPFHRRQGSTRPTPGSSDGHRSLVVDPIRSFTRSSNGNMRPATKSSSYTGESGTRRHTTHNNFYLIPASRCHRRLLPTWCCKLPGTTGAPGEGYPAIRHARETYRCKCQGRCATLDRNSGNASSLI